MSTDTRCQDPHYTAFMPRSSLHGVHAKIPITWHSCQEPRYTLFMPRSSLHGVHWQAPSKTSSCSGPSSYNCGPQLGPGPTCSWTTRLCQLNITVHVLTSTTGCVNLWYPCKDGTSCMLLCIVPLCQTAGECVYATLLVPWASYPPMPEPY